MEKRTSVFGKRTSENEKAENLCFCLIENGRPVLENRTSDFCQEQKAVRFTVEKRTSVFGKRTSEIWLPELKFLTDQKRTSDFGNRTSDSVPPETKPEHCGKSDVRFSK